MTVLTLGGLALQTERTLTLPAVQQRSIVLLHTQIRTTSAVRTKTPAVRKLLAESSAFEIPPAVREREVVKPEAAVEKAPKPAVKAEPKAETRAAIRPTSKAVAKAAASAKKPVPARAAAKSPVVAPKSKGDGAAGLSGSAAVPGTSGGKQVKSDGKSAALAVILQEVEKHKRYPRQGRRSGAEGTCTLLAQISSDGQISSCILSEGSGRVVLDAAARRLGEKLVGLRVGSSGGFRVRIPVHYRLTDR